MGIIIVTTANSVRISIHIFTGTHWYIYIHYIGGTYRYGGFSRILGTVLDSRTPIAAGCHTCSFRSSLGMFVRPSVRPVIACRIFPLPVGTSVFRKVFFSHFSARDCSVIAFISWRFSTIIPTPPPYNRLTDRPTQNGRVIKSRLSPGSDCREQCDCECARV